MEEMICDSLGKMNAFATEATERVAGEVGVFLRNVRKAAKNTGATKNTTGDGGGKYSREIFEDEAKAFSDEITRWEKEGKESGQRFILGSTGEVLQGLGAIESDIYMNGDKIKTILEEHKEITIDEIKQIPKILNDPTLILKSRNVGRSGAQNTRMVLYGSVKGKNGIPVMVVFDIRPMENHLVINDMQKVTSAYTKTNDGVSFVENSYVMFADKKRATSLLRTIGFQMPIELLQGGFTGSITYNKQNVNLYGEKFSNVFRQNSTENKYSREMDTVKALERQNKILQEQRDFWKDQTRLTKVAKADKDSVRRIGRELLREYSSRTKVEDILTDLQWLADDSVGQPKATFDEVTDRAEKVARKVLEGSEVDVNADAAEIRKDLKKYLSDTHIKVTESIKAGIPDFADFKKRNRALHFREDGSGTDVNDMWLELQDQFGTGMFPERITSPEDQVRYIADKTAQIAANMQNPYSKDMEFAVEQATHVQQRIQALALARRKILCKRFSTKSRISHYHTMLKKT